MAASSWIFAFLALALVINTSAALKCWTCRSDRNPECGDPMNTTQHHKDFRDTKECEANGNPGYTYGVQYICKKLVQRENGRVVVHRSCEMPGPEERDIKDGPCVSHDTTHSHVTVLSCHICSTDLCNSATSLTGSRLLFFAAIICIASRFIPTIRSFSV